MRALRQEQAKASVLLVDDVRTNLLALEAVLEPLQLRLVRASSGEEALRQVLLEDFAVILLDVQMGELDGFQTAALLKQRERSRLIPIIFLTATSQDADQVFKAYEHGAVDYLQKPYDPYLLRSKVSVFVALQLAREEARRKDALLAAREREALQRESEQRYRGLAEAMPQIVWTARPDGPFEYLNRRWSDYTGLSLERTLAVGWEEALHPQDVPRFDHSWGDAVEAKVPYEGEYRFRREADGAFRWHLVRATPVRDDDGTLLRWVGTCTDIDDQKQAEDANRQLAEKLRAGEARFRRIMESNILGLMFTDYEGAVLDANDALLQMLGYDRDDLARGAIRWDERTPPQWRLQTEHAIQELRRTGNSSPYEKEYLRKDGTRVHVLVGSTRVEEQDQNITFVLDISKRKRVEAHVRLLAEASAALATSLDFEETLRKVAHFAVPELADVCVVHVVDDQEGIRHVAAVHASHEAPQLLDALQSGDSESGELEQLATSTLHEVLQTGRPVAWLDLGGEGRTAWADESSDDETPRLLLQRLGVGSYLCVPLLSRGKVLGAVTLAFTGSRRRYDEDDLRVAEDLARRAALAADNALLYRDAQQAIRLRDDFLSVASHELKTPLTPLNLKVTTLMQHAEALRGAAVPAERVMGDLGMVSRQVKKLASLVNDLLDVSRITAGRLQLTLENVDLSEVVGEVVTRFSQQAAQAGCAIDLALDEQSPGHWDRTRLEQVVTNLLSNAIKYGRGKPIHVSVTGDAHTAELRVRDHGIGISPDVLPRIFGRFERGVSERHYGGLGLGLFIAREIVDNLGGTIRVDSELDQGSTFSVELPRIRTN